MSLIKSIFKKNTPTPTAANNKSAVDEPVSQTLPLIEGEDFILENGLMVFTKNYHLKRGYCCNSNCRNCPYPTPTTGG